MTQTEVVDRFVYNVSPLLGLLIDRGVDIYLQLDNPLVSSRRFLQCYYERNYSSKASSCSVSLEQHNINLKRQRWVYNSLKKLFTSIKILDISSIYFNNKDYYDPAEDWGFIDNNHVSQKYIKKLGTYYTEVLRAANEINYREEN